MTDVYLLVLLSAWWWAVLNGLASFVICAAIILALIWRDHAREFSLRIVVYRLATVIIAIGTLANIIDACTEPWATNPSEAILNIGLAGWFTTYAIKRHHAYFPSAA